jgi:ADP-ribose pyrophosphatase
VTDDQELVWPRERSEEAGSFRHFHVRRDWNRSPRSGELRDFYILDMPDWVQVLAVTTAGRLVMVEQFRPGTRVVTTEFPAGLIEAGETPEAAAARHPNAALQSNRLFIVLIEACRSSGDRDPDPGEAIRPREVDPSLIEEMIASGRFRDAYGIVAWSTYLRSRNVRTARMLADQAGGEGG